jgi:hypothetical protein
MEEQVVYVGKYRNLGCEDGLFKAGPDKEWILYAHAVGDRGRENLEKYFNEVKESWDHVGFKFEFEIKPETDKQTIEEILARHKIANPN